MGESKCKTCVHYGMLKMITDGVFGYSGDIPCLRCCEYIKPHSEYVLYHDFPVFQGGGLNVITVSREGIDS